MFSTNRICTLFFLLFVPILASGTPETRDIPFPKDLKSPVDNTPIDFKATEIVECDERGLREKYNVGEGDYLRGVFVDDDKTPQSLLVKRSKIGSFYLEMGDNTGYGSTLICEYIYIGFSESGVPWAYSVERKLFVPTPALVKKLKSVLKQEAELLPNGLPRR